MLYILLCFRETDMSKDIRSFFNVLSTKGKATKTSPSVQKDESPPTKKRKNRKRAVIASDSEEDDEPKTQTPKREHTNANGKVSPRVTKKKEESSTSKYFSMSKDKVNSIFGTSPVKQVAPKSGPKSNRATTSELPPEIQNELAGLENIDDWSDDDFADVSSSQLSLNSPKKAVENDSNNGRYNEITESVTPSIKRKAETSLSSDLSPKKLALFPSPRKDTRTTTPKREVLSPSPSPVKPKTSPTIKPHVTKSPSLLSPTSSTQSVSSQQSQSTGGDLWVDKYRPKTLKQIIGQHGENSNVQKLLRWLRDWKKNHSGENKVARPGVALFTKVLFPVFTYYLRVSWAKDNTGAFFKAALLSGPPGIDRSSRPTPYEPLIYHAAPNHVTGTSCFVWALPARGERILLNDRGGIQELISIIKHWKIPVVCITNDRAHPKIRSLVNCCFDLRFSRPRAEQIKGAMRSICYKEGIKLEPSVLDGIIATHNHANEDVRLILNYLAILAAKVDNSMTVSTKDIKMGPWDVVRKVFSESDHKSMSIHDKCDLFFNDYSIAPLFVQENYFAVQPHGPESKSKTGKMRLFAQVATSLSKADLVESAIRMHNSWSLLPVQAVFSSLIPGDVLAGHIGGKINFPEWFGTNSKKTKMIVCPRNFSLTRD